MTIQQLPLNPEASEIVDKINEIIDVATVGENFRVTDVSSSGGVLHLDLTQGNYFTTTLSENITDITFTNPSNSAFGFSLMLLVTQDSGTPRTVNWPYNFRWSGDQGVISTELGAIDLISLSTLSSGDFWDITLSNKRS